MTPSIKITTTDTASAVAFIPVAEALLTQGDVTVCSDGASATLWGRWGEKYIPTNGTLSFIGVYNNFYPKHKPVWQIVGASANSALEYDALEHANKMGANTAVYIDIDGAHRRFHKNIGFVTIFLAATESVRMEILRDYPAANVHVVGTPSATLVDPNQQTAAAIRANGFTRETTVTWAAGGTLSDLQITVDSLITHMKDCALVMGLHPDPTKVAGIDEILKITKPLRKQSRLLWDPSDRQNSLNIPGNTVEKALASFITVGTSSLVLDEAAYNGSKVVSVTTKETWAAFTKVCPEVGQFPCITSGRAVAISNPCDFRKLIFPDIADILGTLLPYSPKMALEALGF